MTPCCCTGSSSITRSWTKRRRSRTRRPRRPRRRGCSRARHRLALSGTPIENHLGELWSLFEFLNPGLLGIGEGLSAREQRARRTATSDHRVAGRGRCARSSCGGPRSRSRRSCRDGPSRRCSCELEPAQRRHYDELRAHYRETLLARIAKDGVNRSKMQILEALLRLRQAACHSGLIDPRARARTVGQIRRCSFRGCSR